MSISLVKSCEKKINELTKVPPSWLKRLITNEFCLLAADVNNIISRSHNLNHFRVDRTLYFVRRDYSHLEFSETNVASVV